jgi:hypothetical protein
MPDDFQSALGHVLKVLLEAADEDTALRISLREIAQGILARTEQPRSASAPTDPSPVSQSPQTAPTKHNLTRQDATHGEEIEQPSIAELAARLTLGGASSASTLPPCEPQYAPVAEPTISLSLIEQRCHLKARGARWAAKRQRLMAGGADFATEIQPIDREIIHQAKDLPDCFLWMNHPSGPSPTDLLSFEELAGCYDTLAEAMALVKRVESDYENHKGEFERALDLAAQAQSALRVCLGGLEVDNDSDQKEAFRWLRETGSDRHIFITRYMRVDDPADPTTWQDLSARIDQLDNELADAQRNGRRRRKLLGKVRHKASLIEQAIEGSDPCEESWRILIESVEELINDGLPPSNRELRDAILPVVDSLPESDYPAPGFQRVLAELDRLLANCLDTTAATSRSPSDEVLAVRQLLEGKAVVLIGGDRRPAHHRAITEAFGLSHLEWVETRSHESTARFEDHVARPDVALVLLAIRWSSHSFADVADFCRTHDKPLVRLPAGYNANQIALRVLEQASQQIES